jgi:hypothetical protein
LSDAITIIIAGEPVAKRAPAHDQAPRRDRQRWRRVIDWFVVVRAVAEALLLRGDR